MTNNREDVHFFSDFYRDNILGLSRRDYVNGPPIIDHHNVISQLEYHADICDVFSGFIFRKDHNSEIVTVECACGYRYCINIAGHYPPNETSIDMVYEWVMRFNYRYRSLMSPLNISPTNKPKSTSTGSDKNCIIYEVSNTISQLDIGDDNDE